MRRAVVAACLTLGACSAEKPGGADNVMAGHAETPIAVGKAPINGAKTSGPTLEANDTPPPTAPPVTVASKPPSPPLPPRPPPSRISPATHTNGGFPIEIIRDIDDPREALFAYVIPQYQQSATHRGKPICLTAADPALLVNLQRRFAGLHAAEACSWRNGIAVFTATGETAVIVSAKVDCRRGVCAGEAGGAYGNLGAEGEGYRMERRGSGWSLQRTGKSWIS